VESVARLSQQGKEPASTSAAPPSVVRDDLGDIRERADQALRRLGGRTVLVTGAAGFLPSYLVDALAHANEKLLPEPCRVLAVDNLATGVRGRLEHLEGREDIVFVESDIVGGVSVDEPVSYIVHGASIASPTWYRRYPLETIDVNVTGTRRLLELAHAHAVDAFLYLSSSEVYGDPSPDRIPTSEDYWGSVSCTGPRACYDESKRLAEALCMTFHRLYGTPIKVARPFNVYGPRLRLDDGRVIPDFLADALNGRPITLYSNGEVTRSFCYITDAITALVLLMVGAPAGEAYNVGNDEEVTVGQVAQTVDRLSGRARGVRFGTSNDKDYLTDNPNRRCPDLTKTKAAIDWSPRVDLEEGIRRTLAFYREEGAR
jgi:UDP-glucuronate decarboxylase